MHHQTNLQWTGIYDKSNEFGLNVHIKENSKIEENSDAFFSYIFWQYAVSLIKSSSITPTLVKLFQTQCLEDFHACFACPFWHG